MFLCVGTTPAVQRVMIFWKLAINEVNRASNTLDGVAGKSLNVAKVLKSLGENPVAVSFLGGDRGDYIREAIQSAGIEMECVRVGVRTRQCVTVIDESSHTHTELVEECRPVDSESFDQLLEIVRRRIQTQCCLVMSGTIAQGGPPDLYRELTRIANEAGAVSVVDAQGASLVEALKAGPGLVKPNRRELVATVGRALNDVSDVMSAMRELAERGARRVVVTAGSGLVFAFDGASFWSIRPPRIVAVNPIGSGDAYTAGLVRHLMQGDDLGEACRWGAAAGAANALTPLAGELNPADVDRLVSQVEVERI